MSQENVDVVRRAFDAFNEGGVDAVVEGGFWAPEIVLDFAPSEIDELVDKGEQVIAFSRQRGRGTSSGVTAELEFTQVVAVRRGRIVRGDFYLDRAKALEAARPST